MTLTPTGRHVDFMRYAQVNYAPIRNDWLDPSPAIGQMRLAALLILGDQQTPALKAKLP